MRCVKCGTESLPGKRFCAECGSRLATRCLQCGAENLGSWRFCPDCGTGFNDDPQRRPVDSTAVLPVTRQISITAEPAEDFPAVNGERKNVTALFADIKGSMELIENLDPEEARAIVDPALELMIDAVHRYGGYIVQSTGDGIFALFGAPIAHEDHPQRAIYSALRMQEQLKRYSDRNRAEGRPPIQVRIGINTGDVVVRTLRTAASHAEYTPIGHSTSLAARMQMLAPIGSIATSQLVRKICEGYFLFRSLGLASIKGVAGPIHVYEVTGIGGLRTHFQASIRRGLTKFVGRSAELNQMERGLELARSGHGGVLAVLGDPGVGKSRLLHEFKARAGADCAVLEAFAVSHGKTSSYLPVIELLKGYFEIGPSDDDRKRREKVNGKIVTLDPALEDTLPYLFTLLSLNPAGDPVAQMDPQIKRRRTQDAVNRILLRESLNQPLIVIVEDLHWIDSETQGLLNLLIDSLANARILLVVNYRPEYLHEWGSRSNYSQLRLDPLTRENAEQMLNTLLSPPLSFSLRTQIAPPKAAEAGLTSRQSEVTAALSAASKAGPPPVIAELKRWIIERTEGNPFFMEEMVQALFEEGALRVDDSLSGVIGSRRRERDVGTVVLTRPLAEIRVPATVQAVLASRIDRLPSSEKELLHTLAVLGREFSLTLVQQVTATPADELERMLSRLQVGEFVYERPAAGDVEYIFKHALTQEVAYNSILVERRKLIHERAAQAIESTYGAQLEDHYSALAYHYGRSSNTPKAVEYLRLAGQQALQRSANAAAISHLTNGLELVRTLPNPGERNQQELGLHIALGSVLVATEGYTTPAVKNVYTRARELCGAADIAQLFSVLNGLRRFHYLRAEFGKAREQAGQLLTLAENGDDPALHVLAHQALGVVSYSLAELTSAREHLQRAPTLYDARQHRFHTVFYGEDPSVIAMSFESSVLWLLGYPDEALAKIRQALKLAEELAHPLSLALALNFAAWLYQLRGDEAALRDSLGRALTLSSEQGLPNWLAQSKILAGWMQSGEGRREEGIAQMREGLADYRATGAMLTATYFLALLADAYARTGSPAQGLLVLNEALDLVNANGERFYESELYRLRGELILQQAKTEAGQNYGDSMRCPATVEAEAENCFRKAVDVASAQQAKSLELRAVMSLSHLRHRQGSKAEARQILENIYGWFTEGFGTADLNNAAAMLHGLAS